MLLITGTTGRVGSAAIQLLQQSRRLGTTVALARSKARAVETLGDAVEVRVANYDDRASLDEAFIGTKSLLFVPSDGAAQDVRRHHRNVIEAAAAADVKHIVCLSIVDIEASSSFYFTPVYRDTEQFLRSCGCDWTILRCNLYWDFVISKWIEVARNTGLIDIPAGLGTLAPITCADVAAAAVASFDPIHRSKVYELTAARSTSMAEIAHVASELIGLPIDYRPVPAAEYSRRCRATMEDPWPTAFVSMMESINEGRLGSISPDLQELLGREPATLDTLLRA